MGSDLVERARKLAGAKGAMPKIAGISEAWACDIAHAAIELAAELERLREIEATHKRVCRELLIVTGDNRTLREKLEIARFALEKIANRYIAFTCDKVAKEALRALDAAPAPATEKRGQTGTDDVQESAQVREDVGDPGGIRTHDPVLRRQRAPEAGEGEKP